MTLDEIRVNASTLVFAGSETTATALSGITYLLGTHPEVLAKLAKEVREHFSDESEIDLISCQHLKYMLAVLDEGLRLFPAVPVCCSPTCVPGFLGVSGMMTDTVIS